MSVQRPGPAQQRLLPAAFEHSLNDLAIRVAGGALVAFAATSWLSLLSWQIREAGSAGRSAKVARNLLGNLGAGLSDMMVHTLGIAVVIALICPMIWGLELLSSVRWIAGFRIKVLAALGAVLALAGVASGLPPVPGWPLLGGAGGMIGDFVFNFAASNLAHFGIERDSWLPVLVLAGTGLLMLSVSLGIRLPLSILTRRVQPVTASTPQQDASRLAGQSFGTFPESSP